MSLDAAGGTNLGSAFGRIVFSSNASEAMGQAQQQLQNGLQQVGSTVTNLGFTMTKALSPVTAFVTGGILAFGNFDQKMAEIAARTGATAEEMELIRQTAIQMGQDTAFSATQAGDGMLQLLTSGSSVEEMYQGIGPVLDLAAAGMLDLGFASDAVTDILAQFGLGAEDAAMVTDVLTKAAGSSSATVEDLIAGFSNVGPLAAAMGMSVEEAAAVLATYSDNGLKGAEAGTQFKSMLTNMTRDTDDVQGMWDQLGISMFDAMGNARPLNDVILDLNAALEGATDERRQQIFSTLAGSFGQMGLLALTASDGITPMLDKMEGAADASTVADAQMSSWKGTVSQLKSSLETFSIEVIGPLVENYLKPLVQRVTEIINKMTAWASENPELAAKIGMVLGVLAVLGPALVGIGSAISLVGGAFAVLLSPIGLVAAAVAGLYLAFRNNFLGIGDFVRPIITNIVNGFSRLVNTIKFFISDIQDFGLAEAILGIFGKGSFGETMQSSLEGVLVAFGISREAAQDVVDKAWSIFNFVALRIRDVINGFRFLLTGEFEAGLVADAGILRFFASLRSAILDFAARAGQAIRRFIDLVTDIWATLQPKLTALLDWFINTGLPRVIDFITTDAIPAIGRFIDILKGIWDLVWPVLQQLADWFLNSALPSVINFITGTVIPAIGDLIQILKDIWNSAGTEIMTFIGAAGAIYGVLVTVAGVVSGFGAAWAALTPIIAAVGVVIAALFSPIGIAILAGAALVTAYTTNFMGIRDFIDNEVRPRLLDFFNWLGNVWETTIKPGMQAMYDWFVTTGLPAILSVINDVIIPGIELYIEVMKGIWTLVSPFLNLLLLWFTEVGWPLIKLSIDFGIEAINLLIAALVGIWNASEGPMNTFKDGISTIFTFIKDNVLGPVVDVIEEIIGGIGKAIELANSIGGAIGDGVDFVTGEVNVPLLGNVNPASMLRDSGGSIGRGEMALIGTGAQPELFVPNTSGNMFPADQLREMMGGGGLNIESVQIVANTYEGGQAAARGFRDELNSLMVQRGLK